MGGFRARYRTMDRNFMNDLVGVPFAVGKRTDYERLQDFPLLPALRPPLSNFEANQGYMEVTDRPTIRFGRKIWKILAARLGHHARGPEDNLRLTWGRKIDYVKSKTATAFSSWRKRASDLLPDERRRSSPASKQRARRDALRAAVRLFRELGGKGRI